MILAVVSEGLTKLDLHDRRVQAMSAVDVVRDCSVPLPTHQEQGTSCPRSNGMRGQETLFPDRLIETVLHAIASLPERGILPLRGLETDGVIAEDGQNLSKLIHQAEVIFAQSTFVFADRGGLHETGRRHRARTMRPPPSQEEEGDRVARHRETDQADCGEPLPARRPVPAMDRAREVSDSRNSTTNSCAPTHRRWTVRNPEPYAKPSVASRR